MASSFGLFNLEGRVALITGSSQGIGFALARGLAEHGATVIINGRDRGKVDQAVTLLEDDGHKVFASAFDVTNAAEVRAAIEMIEEEIGALDILVNNAGMQYRAPLEDFPIEKWQQLLETNISSAFYAGQAAARHMIARRRGKIINIASVQSELARPSIAPYTATKGAIRNLTRGMATDWARHGLQVNAIAPGPTRTRIGDDAFEKYPEVIADLAARTALGRVGEPDDVGKVIAFLLANDGAWITGETIQVAGGYRL